MWPMCVRVCEKTRRYLVMYFEWRNINERASQRTSTLRMPHSSTSFSEYVKLFEMDPFSGPVFDDNKSSCKWIEALAECIRFEKLKSFSMWQVDNVNNATLNTINWRKFKIIEIHGFLPIDRLAQNNRHFLCAHIICLGDSFRCIESNLWNAIYCYDI